MRTQVSKAAMAEWLRRWTRNPMGSSRVGSNPTRSARFFPLSLARSARALFRLEGKRTANDARTHPLLVTLGESSQFFVSKSPGDPSAQSGTFSVGISGPSTVFLDANETEHGYEVSSTTEHIDRSTTFLSFITNQRVAVNTSLLSRTAANMFKAVHSSAVFTVSAKWFSSE